MYNPKIRILIAIGFSLLLVSFNIIAVANGTAEKLYMQLEDSISAYSIKGVNLQPT